MLISTDADFRAIARPSQSGECGPVHGFSGDEEEGDEEGRGGGGGGGSGEILLSAQRRFNLYRN